MGGGGGEVECGGEYMLAALCGSPARLSSSARTGTAGQPSVTAGEKRNHGSPGEGLAR